MLITQQLSQIAMKNLARPVYRYLGKETNYSQFKAQVSKISYLLQHEIGMQPRVALFASNSPSVLTLFFALSNIRGIAIPVNPNATPDEVVAWLKDSQATHIAVTSDLLPKIRDILRHGHLSLPILEIEKKQGGEYDTSFTTSPEHQPKDTDPILILRTAGTTDKPKFCIFTHKQLLHASNCMRSLYHLNVTDRFFTTMNWFHPFPLLHSLFFPVLNGATTVIDHGLEGSELLDFLIEARANRLISTPPWFFKLLITCRNEQNTLPGIKSITVGGGKLDPSVEKVFGMMKAGVSHVYGQTENLWTVSMSDTAPDPDDEFPGLHKPLAGLKYKVLDSNGDEITGSDSRTGLLAVMGPTIMTKYDGPDKDKETEKKTKSVLRGTWLYTGDYARLEGEGETLRIEPLGRIQDLMDLDGELIPMDKITAVLRKIPGINDASAFVTVTSQKEKLIACAVVKAESCTLNEEKILDACMSKLNVDLVPKIVFFTENIPKDLSGNPNYGRLRAQFSGAIG